MALILVFLLASCFGPVDLSRRACPCVAGWMCVAGSCVPEGSDGGTEDAGREATDGGTLACPADAFCEDFEESSPASNGWTVYPDFTRVSFVDARSPDPSVAAHRGSGMVRVTTTTPGASADLVICPFDGFTCPTDLPATGTPPGITSGDLYLRAYVYVPTTLPSGMPFEMGHASVLYTGSHRGPWADGEDVVGFNLDVDRTSMYVGTIGERIEPRPAAGDPDPRPVFPRDTWTCVRVEIHLDGAAGSVATYVGSSTTPAVSRTGIDTVPRLPFLHFGIGLGYTEEMPNGAAVYADDVAFGRSPIPCFE